jgi:endonuclease-3 related protein
LLRHGWLDESAEVDDLRATITDLAEEDASRLMRLSESMDQIARVRCRSAHPECEECPLRSFLPESGPIEPF